MINELKAQLARCETWLQEEPDDQEVITKANELRAKIQFLESGAKKEEVVEDGYLKEIKRLKKKIRNLKKKLESQKDNPFIKDEIKELEIKVEKLKIERGK